MSEAGKISQKIKVWFSDYFNVSDFLAILTFFIGFGLRLGGGDAFVPGRTVYCLNIIFWYVRLLDILAVNQQAGPYVMMIAKMVSSDVVQADANVCVQSDRIEILLYSYIFHIFLTLRRCR